MTRFSRFRTFYVRISRPEHQIVLIKAYIVMLFYPLYQLDVWHATLFTQACITKIFPPYSLETPWQRRKFLIAETLTLRYLVSSCVYCLTSYCSLSARFNSHLWRLITSSFKTFRLHVFFVFIIFVFTLFFIVFLLKTKPLWPSKPHAGLTYSMCLYGVVFSLDLVEYCDSVL